MFKKGILFFIVLVLSGSLSACYKEAHTSVRFQDISFQFDEPRDYCASSESNSGLDMQCDEGMIVIRFYQLEPSESTLEILERTSDISDEYVLQTIAGKRGEITLATQRTTPTNQTTPSFIALIPMKGELVAVAEGFANSPFENEFETIFTNLIQSFEP